MTGTRWRAALGAAALALLTACSSDATGTDETQGAGGAGQAGQGGKAGTAGKAGPGGAGAGGSAGGAGGGGTAGQGGTAGAAGAGGAAGSSGGGTAGVGGTAGAAGVSGGSGQSGAANGGQGGSAAGGQGGGGAAGTTAGGSGGLGEGGAAGAGAAGAAGTGGSGGGGAGGAAGAGGNAGGQGGSEAGGVGGSACVFPLCASAGNGGGPPVAGEDRDKDGFAFPEDCNDCDPGVNPGALDRLDTDEFGIVLPDAQQIDQDCTGSASQVDRPVCDGALALDDGDPVAAARAFDLCQPATGKAWGVVSAGYVQLDGSPLPVAGAPVAPALGHGLVTGFGPAAVQHGAAMLALSTGTARLPGQPGYGDPAGGDKGYATAAPVGFPIASAACGVATGGLRDSIALRLRLRAPTNVTSFSFRYRFYTHAFPDQVCTASGDVLLASMRDQDGNFIAGADPATGNIAFDKFNQSITVNDGFLDVCTPQTAGGKVYTCEAGSGDLVGTGFEGHAGTSWLQTTAPVVPGEEFELLLGVADAGDGLRTSTVLLDSFEFSGSPGVVTTGSLCHKGTSGVCATCQGCLDSAGANCCLTLRQACEQDPDGPLLGCPGILACGEVCAGNKGCEQGCRGARPAGQAEFDAYHACLYGSPGNPDDPGACGLVCAP